jgi:hypothetical protein
MVSEFAQVVHAPAGLDLLARRQRRQGGRARLLCFSVRQVSVGEDHRGAESRAAGDGGTALGVVGGVRGSVEIAQAVAELGGKFGLVEVLEPVGVAVWLAPF